MLKVIFVCYGNICRSPMAEFIFKKLIKEKNSEKDFAVSSAATSDEEIGNPVYYLAAKKLDQIGAEYRDKRAVRLTKEMADRADYIICMEKSNISAAKSIVGEENSDKLYRLLDFTDSPRDVADPWYTRDFDAAFRDVSKGVEAFYDFAARRQSARENR